MRTFLLPDLGEGLTDAELVNWLVAEGDTIAVDQPVAEVETAKSLVEVPSPFAGVVETLHGAAGESIDVGKPLISVRTTAAARIPEDVPAAAGAAPAPAEAPDAAGEAYRQEERAGSGNVLIGYGTPDSNGANRR
uniref:biotin/lipoyl-containing protein n=1 Tax=Arthrobacter sp. TaxID=1667 RepID=UPI00289D2096